MGRSFEDAYEAEFIHAWAELSDSEIADAIGPAAYHGDRGSRRDDRPRRALDGRASRPQYGLRQRPPRRSDLRLTFADGSTATVPVVEHLYLTSTARGAQAETVTAFDAAGNQVAQRTLGPDAATRG
jgi:hypothetical protein